MGNATPAPLKVILIEDNPDDAELIIRILRKKTTEDVLHFANGEEALHYFDHVRQKDKPAAELVLLDIKMPKVDGFTVLQRIKGDRATARIPVTVITSSNHASDVEKAYALGANSYIVKPVDYDAFCGTMEAAVNYWQNVNYSV
jgi:two-component system, response regulator